jgi:hypothetical protein
LKQRFGRTSADLSPYSPDFNPIENCWCGGHCRIPAAVKRQQGRQSKLKAYLRSVAARSREALEEAISLGLDLITKRDIKSWFSHCCVPHKVANCCISP